MLTQVVIDCVSRAMANPNVEKAINERDRHKKIILESIHSKIVRRKNEKEYFAMVVRLGFDYLQNVGQIKEDFLVDVEYHRNKKTGAERFKVKEPVFISELPNP